MRARVVIPVVVAAGVAAFAMLSNDADTSFVTTGRDAHVSVSARGASLAARDLGVEHRYALELKHASSGAQNFEITVAGEWALSVLESNETTTTVRAELREPSLQIGSQVAQATSLAKPYTFTLAANGRLVALQFPKDLDPEARSVLTAITASAQIVDGGVAPAWTSTETDSLGSYEASYTRTGSTIRKAKTRYTPRDTVAVRILESAADVAMRGDGWLDTIESRERVEVGVDRVSVVVAGHVRLRHVGSGKSVATAPEQLETVAIDATSTANMEASDRELLDGATLGDLLAAYALLADDSHASGYQYLRLVALFRLDPDAAKAAATAVIAGAHDERATGAIVGALGEAGTSQAQTALAGVLVADRAPSKVRVHAAAALGMTGTPTPQTLSDLSAASREQDPEISATAMLALGNASMRVRSHDAALAGARVDELLARLAAATDDELRMVILRALGNTGDARVLPALELALASEHELVRAAATESLRLVPEARVDELVRGRLRDVSSTVRAAAVFAASHRAVALYVTVLAQLYRAEPEGSVRRAIVELAGMRGDEAPALKPIIEDAADDADEDVRKTAQAFLQGGQG